MLLKYQQFTYGVGSEGVFTEVFAEILRQSSFMFFFFFLGNLPPPNNVLLLRESPRKFCGKFAEMARKFSQISATTLHEQPHKSIADSDRALVTKFSQGRL